MKVFLDTNVLIYALASDDTTRQGIAQRLFAQHGADHGVVLSTQVLLETYNVLTRKKGVKALRALAAVRMLAQQPVVAPTTQTALQAMALSAQHSLSIWDALVVQAALEAGCDTLYSEDLQAGRRFGPLEVVNPFDVAAHEVVPAAQPLKSAKARRPRTPPRRS